MAGVVILCLCTLRLGQFAYQSNMKISRYFWLASVLVFLTVIRRELNFLPQILGVDGLSMLGYSYDWWEDGVLLVLYLCAAGLLLYSWRYLAAVLKSVPLPLYGTVAVLAALQYMGENAILIPPALGVMVEESCEDVIYTIALMYLYYFDVAVFNRQLMDTCDAKQAATQQ